jgi:uncharacterized protein (TIGR02679 family)
MLAEIIKYFKSDKGFDRVMCDMYDTYTRSGRVFGAVRLSNPSKDEESALSSFFKRDYFDQAMIRISLAEFERQVHRHFFAGRSVDDLDGSCSLENILVEYTGKPLKKADEKSPAAKFADTFSDFIIGEVLPEFINTPAESWLYEISTQTRRTYRALAQTFFADSAVAVNLMKTAAHALNTAPAAKSGGLIPLTQFAEKTAGSAYALDFHTACGQLFLRAIACRFDCPAPSDMEDNIGLHLRAGLLSYGMLSCVMTRGIVNSRQVQVLSLENLNSLENLHIHGNKVFVIEDSQVFAAVCERLDEENYTIVCPAFGFTAAFMYLLEICRTADAQIYYAGNMNYKGLTQADKLYLQFGKNFVPWRYSREDYAEILTENVKPLPDEKKGLAMHNETLASLLSQMRKTDKTAPSMPLVPRYVEDIKISVQ